MQTARDLEPQNPWRLSDAERKTARDGAPVARDWPEALHPSSSSCVALVDRVGHLPWCGAGALINPSFRHSSSTTLHFTVLKQTVFLAKRQ